MGVFPRPYRSIGDPSWLASTTISSTASPAPPSSRTCRRTSSGSTWPRPRGRSSRGSPRSRPWCARRRRWTRSARSGRWRTSRRGPGRTSSGSTSGPSGRSGRRSRRRLVRTSRRLADGLMPWPGRRRWVPPPPAPVEVRPGETILLIGKPGTGKSTLGEWMVREASSCIVYDTKNDPDEQAKWVAAGFTAVEDPAELDHHARALMVCDPAWAGGPDSHRDRLHLWSRALDHPFHRVPTALVFDEVLNVFPVGGGHPGTLKLLHQGRSRGHVLIAGSQMATGIDTRLIQLAHHIVALGVLEGQQMRHLAT